MDAYLERLDLFELRVRFLEREANKPWAGSGHAPAIDKLAQLYAGRLLGLTVPLAIDDLKRRLEKLLTEHPAARTVALRLTLLEGDYNRAEALALKWVGDPSATTARADALKILDAIQSDLDTLRDAGLKEVERGNEGLEHLPDGPRREHADQTLQKTAALAGRATYFASWTNYYRALLGLPGANQPPGFEPARLGFLRLLEVPADEEIRADTLSPPEDEAQARILLGLGLAELACGRLAEGQACFAALRDEQTPATVRDWADHWNIWALLRAGKTAAAQAAAAQAVASFKGEATPGKLALCKVLVQAPDAAPSGLGAVGIRGLVHLKRFDLARSLMRQSHIESDGANDAVGHWMRGQTALEAAESGKARDDFDAAKAAFEAALNAPGASERPELTAECRYSIGWCQFRLGDYEDSLASFQRAAADLAALKSLAAADAAWMVALTRMKLEPPDSTAPTGAIAALRAFRETYPDHPNAARVDELLAKIRQETKGPESSIGPGAAPPDARASLAVARRHFERWGRLAPGRKRDAPVAADLRAALDALLALPEPDKHPEETLEGLLMAKDLALSADPPDWEKARSLLDRAKPAAAALPPESRLAADFHYALFQRAQADNDGAALRLESSWLTGHKEGKLYEKAVLAALASRADAALSAANDSARAARRAEALDAYRKLAAALGDTPSRLRANKSALIACSRLAGHAMESDQFDLAARTLDKLLAAYPDDSAYLRRAGLAHYRAGHDEKSLECWRPLVLGLPADSEGWYEAKYYQLSCLAQLDPKKARAALDQFRQLHPDGGPGRWPGEFRQLAARVR